MIRSCRANYYIRPVFYVKTNVSTSPMVVQFRCTVNAFFSLSPLGTVLTGNFILKKICKWSDFGDDLERWKYPLISDIRNLIIDNFINERLFVLITAQMK